MDRDEFMVKVVSPAAFTIGLFLVWEIACRLFSIPLTILPAPTVIFAALVEFRDPIISNSWVTLWTTLVGFALATIFGLLLGIAVGWHKAIYAGIYPLLVGFNSIPKVAVVPVLILWFPYFFGSLKVAITLAFVGAVVSETVGANKGIGKLMLDAQAAFQVQIVFAGLLVLAVLGILLYIGTALIEKRFTGWAFRGQNR